MKRTAYIFLFTIVLLTAFQAFGQKQIESRIQRDPVLEADAKHNLDVALNYFKTRKAYRAVLLRFEETFAAYPDFSKMDEFLYIAGMSSIYLAENKGKQKLDAKATEEDKKRYNPQKLREDALVYFNTIVEKFPQSKFKSDAEKMLNQLEAK